MTVFEEPSGVRGKPRFSPDDAHAAYEKWGCNCGPAALAAILEITLDQARELLPGFDAKRYTNPTMMRDALVASKRRFQYAPVHNETGIRNDLWPEYGLARIQWEGPWTKPGVPMAARYRYTHWVGVQRGMRIGLAEPATTIGIFDVNGLAFNRGWWRVEDWEAVIVPAITREYKHANGRWYVTHAIKVSL